MPTVHIPPQMRDLTGGAADVDVEARTLRQVVAALEARHPGFAARVTDGERLAAGLAVSIDGVVTSRGLLAQLEPASQVHFLPAFGGG
jgi:molybdopterin synthase sulfur carrier subunit